MPAQLFLERVWHGAPVVADGATGTMLMERGLKLGECPEAFNLERPQVLEEIARAYLEAGAELIGTNTFGGSAIKLASYDLDSRTEEINRIAVEAVRRVVGDHAWIMASCGPCGKLLKPYGDADPDVVLHSFERQIGAQVAAGADVICVETMIDLTEARLAIRAARTMAPAIPVIATMTFDETPRGFFTIMGVSVEQAVNGLAEEGADLVGSNCGNGSEKMLAIAEEMRAKTELPLVIQSNAGLPENRAGVVIYPESPEIMTARVRSMLELGVRVVGGCCGTTPDHIRAFRHLVDTLQAT